jgi:hypothetical protein
LFQIGWKAFVNVPEDQAVIENDRGVITTVLEFHLSTAHFTITIRTHTITVSPPRVVESIAPVSRSGERVIRVRLPRHLTVELSDIFVLNICVRGEVHGNYAAA